MKPSPLDNTQAPAGRISMIGCGRVGQALGRAWTAAGTCAVQDVLNRSLDSAQRAVAFIGAGTAIADYRNLRPADFYLIGTGDGQIASCVEQLARTGLLSPQTVVFHCSGALSAAIMQAAIECGAPVASVHPIRSFADPAEVANNFSGTWCGMEGDPRACELLRPLFSAIGANVVAIDARFKIVYHAAAVFASNYLVTLLGAAVQAYEKAGVPPETARELMAPLVRNTVDNVLRLGPAAALSGPIARGDHATAIRQHEAIAAWDPAYGDLYKLLGKLTADLAGKTAPDFS